MQDIKKTRNIVSSVKESYRKSKWMQALAFQMAMSLESSADRVNISIHINVWPILRLRYFY